MRKAIFGSLLTLVLVAAIVTAQATGITLLPGSNTLKSLHFQGYPGLGIYSPSAGTMYMGNETYGLSCVAGSVCTLTGTTMTTATLTSPTIATPTITSPTISSPTISGATTVSQLVMSITADAAVDFGNTVMPDASAALRFDINGAGGTGAIGVLGGVGPSVQATAYPVIFGGQTRVAIAEDQDVALGEYLVQSGTAGKCNATTIGTIGLNVGRVLEIAPVTFTINHAGCTGGSGCINTALDTPSTGPAGQITLAANAAAAGWTVGDPVIFWNSGGTTPTGLTDGMVYFLVSVSTTKVTVSLTVGGTSVIPSDQGDDATQYLQRLPLSVVHVY